MPNLHVFISYATEDEPIAAEFSKQLNQVFGIAGMVQLTFAPQFSLGTDWRLKIEKDLDRADVLLLISTGRNKPSHSFTGFEVGFFRNSVLRRPKMTDFKDQDRLILSVAVFSGLPQTVNGLQGLMIDPVVVDRACLKDRSRFIEVMRTEKTHSIRRVFNRICDILRTKNVISDSQCEQLRAGIETATDAVHGTIFDQLQRRERETTVPERKIVFRLPHAYRVAGDPWREATIEFCFEEKSFNPVGFGAFPQGPMSWTSFLDQIADTQVRASWRDAIVTLVRDALNDEPTENRQQITLPDRDRAYGTFLARGVQYLSGIDEFDIYLVDIGPVRHDNYEMTRLVAALSIGLRYRQMFLSGKNSSYSVEKVKAVLIDRLQHRIGSMVRDLDLLLWQSQAAGLMEEDFLAQIHDHMPGSAEDFDCKMERWGRAKQMLYGAANMVLEARGEPELTAAKAKFLPVLKDFCTETVTMNREFVGAVFGVLSDVVRSGADLYPNAAAAIVHAGQALHGPAAAAEWGASVGPTVAPVSLVPPVPPVARNGGGRNGHRKPT
ncbi:hypothetical protein CCR97_13210 [Rhodoplanes elegans]|uniref:TIR domain-containing protein n=1 Tax=Rhodoplanes elegans TaxID=29408 RepID=A0A327KEP1_9BRAD|nr:toll/interleukin-1 receptor domain-containing protein [Rhodoplanes elegans]MBK5959159.1 hypothetical protein [Rhodoplanes elegans]RAI37259.1 hypothetical protein CH338_16420 [Rhodoplanes elegans]